MGGRRVLTAIFQNPSGWDDTTLPPALEKRGADRLPILIFAIAIFFGATIPLRYVTWGKPDDLISLSDLVAGTFAALSLLLAAALRFGRLPSGIVLKIGLAYEIILCFALALIEQVLIGFSPMPFRLSLVAIVLVSFPLLVPSPPLWRFVATALAACAQPLALVFVHFMAGGVLEPIEVALSSAPTVLVAFLAAWIGQVVHRLRLDAGRALSFGQYELVRKLGEGGMGEVWEARHAHLLRPAAIKLIRPDTAGMHGEAARTRFKREAQATGALASPHTVELFDFGVTEDGTLYYAMELLEGIDLESFLARFGPMEPARVLHVIDQTARSLAEAHELGLVHRDIKPANIYLCRLGTEHDFVKVLDFGLVKPRFVAEDSPVSVAGAVSGTPGYVAPEHAAGRELDGRADLYSLGCVAYYLLTGQRVFVRPTKMALLAAHLSEDPVPPSKRVPLPIPEALDRLVLDLLARDPKKRPESSRALLARIAELRSFIEPRWTDVRAREWWSTHLAERMRPRRALVL
jgi:eukaryotic-like serine/threonine-protein kinase